MSDHNTVSLPDTTNRQRKATTAIQAANVIATLTAALNSTRNAELEAKAGQGREQAVKSSRANSLEVERADLISEYSKVLEMVRAT